MKKALQVVMNKTQIFWASHKSFYQFLVDIGLFIFAVSGTLRFVPTLPVDAGVINDRSILVIVLLTIPLVKWGKNKYIILLLVSLATVSLLSWATGAHQYNLDEAWEQAFRWGSFYLMAIGLVEIYKDQMFRFINIWFIALIAVLGTLSIVYVSEINWNIRTLFDGMIGNLRMSRVSIGFMNVNNLGGFSATLIMLSVFNLINSKSVYKVSAVLAIIFGGILLINSGARTPFISLVGVILGLIIFFFSANMRAKLWKVISGLFLLLNVIITYFLMFGDRQSDFFQIANKLLSSRLFLSNAGIEWLFNKSWAAYLYGAGLNNVQHISEIVYKGNGFVSMDMSTAYYFVGLGFVGLLVVLGFWHFALRLLGNKGDMIAVLTGIYMSVFMITEATLFSVNGLFGAFWTVFFLILLRNIDRTDMNFSIPFLKK